MSLAQSMLRRGFRAGAVLVLAAAPLSVQAGAYLRSEGELQLRLSASLSQADDRFDENRRLVDADCTTRRSHANLHGEYGYSYYYTLFAAAEVGMRECATKPRTSGLTDLTVGARGRLNVFRNGRSWELSLKLPVKGTTDDPARPGNDAFGVNAGVHFRLTPDPYDNPSFALTEGVWSWGTGVRLWTGGLAHQWWGYLDWGRNLNPLWSVSARLDGLFSIRGGRATETANFQSNDYDKISASINLSRRLSTDTFVTIGIGHDLWGRRADRDTTLSLGVANEWR